MRSTVGIVSLVAPRDGMNGREFRGGFPPGEGTFLSSPESRGRPWGPPSQLSSVYREG
jgi:hypothetical protein